MRTENPHTILLVPLVLPRDSADLVDFLTSERWPFHVNASISEERARSLVSDGTFSDDSQATFWIVEGERRLGLIRAFDLDDVDDGSPLFDIRIAERHRGRGAGRRAVQALLSYLFERFPELERIAATTRADNHAMRAVLRTCSFAKEGHFRESWPDSAGVHHDSVYYGLLRRDWASGVVTPVRFYDDAPED